MELHNCCVYTRLSRESSTADRRTLDMRKRDMRDGDGQIGKSDMIPGTVDT